MTVSSIIILKTLGSGCSGLIDCLAVASRFSQMMRLSTVTKSLRRSLMRPIEERLLMDSII